MAFHPAEFARRGYHLLQQISKDFYSHRDDLIRLRQLYTDYDARVKQLYHARLDWTDRDYLIKNIEAFIIGSIGSMLIALAAVLALEQLDLFHLNSLAITLQIYIVVAIAGGIAWTLIRGPRQLQDYEKNNKTIMELYKSASQLLRKYEALKKVYQMKMLEPGEAIGELPSELTEGGAASLLMEGMEPDYGTNSNGKKNKKRNWGLSEEEREARRNILSLRFLMKVSKLKEGVVEEKVIQQPFILIIEPDEAVAKKLSNILDGQYVMLTFPSIDAMNEHELERKPNMIITEADVPNLEYMQSVELLAEQFSPDKTAIIINTARDSLESLVRAKELGVVDYWIKQIGRDDNVTFDSREIIAKINQIFNGGRSSFARQLDRRIRRKQFRAMNDEEEIQIEKPSIMVASADYTLTGLFQEELEKYHTDIIAVNQAQMLFSAAMAEKPDLIILDATISEENVVNICKMLNIRLAKAKIVVIVKNPLVIDAELKAKDIKILKRFTHPYNSREIVEYIISTLELHGKQPQQQTIEQNKI
ncbi:response regulator [candidate division KSB1 bacterium]|nr:response regulator [candidate division KSB1 bacterium]